MAAIALAGMMAGIGLPATAREKRCGWIQNPTPANWSFVDREGEWVLGVQGGYQAPGLDALPDLTEKNWVRTNGSYGYGCGCMTADTDRKSKRVIRLVALTQRPVAVCRRDKRLPRQ